MFPFDDVIMSKACYCVDAVVIDHAIMTSVRNIPIAKHDVAVTANQIMRHKGLIMTCYISNDFKYDMHMMST